MWSRSREFGFGFGIDPEGSVSFSINEGFPSHSDTKEVISATFFCRLGAEASVDQVDHVHHEYERGRDVDVAVRTGADEAAPVVTATRVVDAELAPGERDETGRHEDAEHEALPVTLAAQRPTERQSCRLLLTCTHNTAAVAAQRPTERQSCRLLLHMHVHHSIGLTQSCPSVHFV